MAAFLFLAPYSQGAASLESQYQPSVLLNVVQRLEWRDFAVFQENILIL